MENYFVTAIGTDSGKTLVSAILVEALGLNYWKPVQAGMPRDTDSVQTLLSRSDVTLHPEQYCLKTPASPHAAAKIDGVQIRTSDFILPSDNGLIIEGAGGALVPLNDNGDFVIDIPIRWDIEVVLVANLYLGSINHTLLTAALLQQKGCRVKGIIFNGPANKESEDIILKHSGYPCLLRIHQEKSINKEVVRRYADTLLQQWK